jgi:hypothetical protein
VRNRLIMGDLTPITMLVAAAAVWLYGYPAQAGCGFDPICHISESIGNGAGRGLADSVRPLVTEVMEREAPALIAQLQAGIDHDIMTAEQAGEKLTDYATKLLNKAADDVLANVQDRSQKLADYARDQTIAVEQQVFNDVKKIIDQLHCEALGVDTLISRQQKIFDDNANSWLRTVFFWRNRKDEIDTHCRDQLGINKALKTSDMQIPTTFKLWRCVRLAYVDPNGKATAIRDAFNDIDFDGRATMCALRTGAEVALREVTETWIHDTQSAKAWDRAIRGE